MVKVEEILELVITYHQLLIECEQTRPQATPECQGLVKYRHLVDQFMQQEQLRVQPALLQEYCQKDP